MNPFSALREAIEQFMQEMENNPELYKQMMEGGDDDEEDDYAPPSRGGAPQRGAPQSGRR